MKTFSKNAGRMVGSFALALVALVALAALGCGAATGVCTSVCGRQYSECVASSSPGASQTDCAAREQQCSAQCKEKR